jgi:hypothetical protein
MGTKCFVVRRSEYLDARGQRLKIEFRMTCPVRYIYGTVIDLFPLLLVPMYLYVYPNHRCRTVVEYTCIQLHMSLIQYPLAIVDGYVFL